MHFASYLSSSSLLHKAIHLGSMALLLLFGTSAAQASTYNRALSNSSYKSFAGDVNGDGRPDVLLRAEARIIIIPFDDDLSIPIRVAPKSPTFVLMSNAEGAYSLTVNPGDSIVNNSAWQINSHDLIFGDVLGTGIGSMLIRGRTQGMPSFVVATSAANGLPYLVQQLTPANIGMDLSAPGTEAMLTDQNGDGRTDLVVNMNGRIALVLLADANGAFYRDDAATIRAVWLGFINALNAGDASKAVQYFVSGSRAQYEIAFAEIGSDISTIGPTFSGIQFVEVQPTYARLVIKQTVAGTSRMYFVTFVFGRNGWSLQGL